MAIDPAIINKTAERLYPDPPSRTTAKPISVMGPCEICGATTTPTIYHQHAKMDVGGETLTVCAECLKDIDRQACHDYSRTLADYLVVRYG